MASIHKNLKSIFMGYLTPIFTRLVRTVTKIPSKRDVFSSTLQKRTLRLKPGIKLSGLIKKHNPIMSTTSHKIYILHLLIVEKKKKKKYCNDHKITEIRITDKNSSTAYIVLYEWIDTWFLDSNRRVGVWSLPWRWHILSIPLTTGRGTSAETCGLDDAFPPDDLGSRPEAQCWYIYVYIHIYVHSSYEFCYRSYIQRECHSVLAKLHPITFYRGVRGSWAECHFLFSLVYQLCLSLW